MKEDSNPRFTEKIDPRRRSLLGALGIGMIGALFPNRVSGQETTPVEYNLNKPFPSFVDWYNANIQQGNTFPLNSGDSVALLARREFTQGLGKEPFNLTKSPKSRNYITQMLGQYFVNKKGDNEKSARIYTLDKLGADINSFYRNIMVISALNHGIIEQNLNILGNEIYNPEIAEWNDDRTKLERFTGMGAKKFVARLIKNGGSDFRVMYAAITLGIVTPKENPHDNTIIEQFYNALNDTMDTSYSNSLLNPTIPQDGELNSIFNNDGINSFIGHISSKQGFEDGSGRMISHGYTQGSWIEYVQKLLPESATDWALEGIID